MQLAGLDPVALVAQDPVGGFLRHEKGAGEPVAGHLLVYSLRESPLEDEVVEFMRQREPLPVTRRVIADRTSLLAGRPADGSVAAGPVIFACHAVGRDALIRVIASGEAVSVKAIGRLLVNSRLAK